MDILGYGVLEKSSNQPSKSKNYNVMFPQSVIVMRAIRSM